VFVYNLINKRKQRETSAHCAGVMLFGEWCWCGRSDAVSVVVMLIWELMLKWCCLVMLMR